MTEELLPMVSCKSASLTCIMVNTYRIAGGLLAVVTAKYG